MDGFQVAMVILLVVCFFAALWFIAPILIWFLVIVLGAVQGV